ncbi:MAG TPA: alpha-L-fucosidase [Phycisphaerae bacterium]|nr:alpha-L-fucosidase [Phycisphaerae bacterium]
MRRPVAILTALIALSASPSFAQTPAAPAPSPDDAARRAQLAEGGNSPGYDMAPITRPEVVAAAMKMIQAKIPPGPFQPTWQSLKQHYTVPQWFVDAKFGIFMHWGLYSVPAYGGGGAAEWYETHLYAGGATLAFHTKTFGPLDQFGYKDFIPKFTAAKWNPDAWAELFKKSGARYVIPTAQHHDNFSNWNSKANPINAVNMGPHRDLIGDLAAAVRKQGLKFGVSNHGIEAFQFVKPSAQVQALLKPKQADLYDPKWELFYHTDRSDEACEKFLANWVARNVELIDQYQPDMLWFDNGVDQRYLDPLKFWIAAYYYNRAIEWGKQVSISTKKAAYAPGGDNIHTIGSILDFEKIGTRSPAGIRTGAWQVDQPIGSQWGYATNMRISSPAQIIDALADTVSKNGNLLLNISPTADGEIPQNQQQTLLAVGQWLAINGEAIYGSHNWYHYGEGIPARGQPRTAANIRFTVKADALCAIVLGDPPASDDITITSLATTADMGKITAVTMLGNNSPLPFQQTNDGLHVTLPKNPPSIYACVLKISGATITPNTATPDGNPIPHWDEHK